MKKQGTEVSKWKKLATSTVKARQKRWGYYKRSPSGASGSGPILRWTGTLEGGFVSKSGGDFVVVSNDVPYFKFHQTRKTGGDLPRRIILDLRQSIKLKIQNDIAKRINDEVKNFGRQL